MSLIKDVMTECIILDRTTVSDGLGGYIQEWKEGATIDCAIVLDTSMTARLAASQGVENLYTITTNKNVNLEFHTVIKRLSDNKIFRITSDGDDKVTPPSASLNMRQVTAEEWRLPS